MISLNRLGNLGRLANQMFQYASLKGIAAKNNYQYCIPPKNVFGSVDENVRKSDTIIYDCFDLSYNFQDITNYSLISETGFDFDENLFNSCPDNVDLIGYFQSEKYFKHIEDDIRNDFKFKDHIYEPTKEQFVNIFGDAEVISVHIRRGDYVTNNNHPVQSLEYYKKGLELLDDNLSVLVFSDDPNWCNEQDMFSGDRFFVSETNNSNIDLCLMSLCSYHIIANSSFSWWGSWLAKSKKTIAPKNWFGGDCASNNTKDLYLNDWIVL